MVNKNWVDIRPTKEEKRAGREEDELYGKDLSTGYGIFLYGTTGLLHIEQWDSMGTFSRAWEEDPRGAADPDMLAAMQAERDGKRLIPEDELPVSFPYHRYGWIDSAVNRRAVERVSREFKKIA